jgi:diacylglycerol kinase
MSYLKKRNQAFKYAFSGLVASLKTEAHMRLHAVAAISATILALYFDISKTEWLAIILCISAVMVTELINTALERICDLVQPDYNASIKYIKDICAAAVLLSSLAALIIGILIFYEPLKTRLGF